MQVSTTDQLRAGQVGRLRILLDSEDRPGDWTFTLNVGADPNNPFPDDGVKHRMRRGSDFEPEVTFVGEGRKTLTATQPATASQPEINHEFEFDVLPEQLPPVPTTNVALVVPDAPRSEDEILWSFINQITNRMRFEEFHEFVKPRLVGRGGPEWYGTDAFRRLRKAAEDFVGIAADPLGAVDDAERTVVNELTRSTVLGGLDRSYVSSEGADLAQPFLRFATPNGDRPSRRQFAPRGQQNGKVEFPLPNVPFVELIWNYWHEEGMLVQSLNRILARFQNRRVGPGHDSLSRFDLNPLLPLRNLLWGFVEDETRRLTVPTARGGVPVPVRAAAGRARGAAGGPGGGAADAVPRGVPLAAARESRVLQGARRHSPSPRTRSRCSAACVRCTWCSRGERTTSSPTCRSPPARRCSRCSGCSRSRRCGSSSAARRWCPTRSRGWTGSTR